MTHPEPVTDVPTETWRETVHKITETIEKSVRLDNAPDITWKPGKRRSGGTCRPYSIVFKYVRFNGGPWRSTVAIYALRTGHIVGSCFPPAEVYQPPQWLTSLIERSSPAADATL
jgi:hypothetical protein